MRLVVGYTWDGFARLASGKPVVSDGIEAGSSWLCRLRFDFFRLGILAERCESGRQAVQGRVQPVGVDARSGGGELAVGGGGFLCGGKGVFPPPQFRQAAGLVVQRAGEVGLALALAHGLTGHRAGRALTLLARAALSDPAASAVIAQALSAEFPNLAVPALAVATETNPQIGEQLADILESAQWPVDLLKQAAAVIFQRLTDASEDDSDERGRNLIHLSNRLSDLGRREDALAATEEAVTIRRQLAAARPDAFLPDLASSLNNQSSCLSELGRSAVVGLRILP